MTAGARVTEGLHWSESLAVIVLHPDVDSVAALASGELGQVPRVDAILRSEVGVSIAVVIERDLVEGRQEAGLVDGEDLRGDPGVHDRTLAELDLSEEDDRRVLADLHGVVLEVGPGPDLHDLLDVPGAGDHLDRVLV